MRGRQTKNKYTFHSFRHVYASALFYERIPDHLIAAYMGHANANITRAIYTHVIKDIDAKERVAKESDNVVILKGA